MRDISNPSVFSYICKWRKFSVYIYIYIYIYTHTHTHTHIYIHTWVRSSWIEFNNCPTRCDLFNLLHFCRQLYMFRVLTPIMRSWYSCNYSFWHWSTGSTTIRSRCWVFGCIVDACQPQPPRHLRKAVTYDSPRSDVFMLALIRVEEIGSICGEMRIWQTISTQQLQHWERVL